MMTTRPDFKLLTQQLERLYKEKPIHFHSAVLDLAGPGKKKLRQEYMLFLTGDKLPVVKCGVNAILQLLINRFK